MENKKLFDYNIFLIGFMGCGKSTIAGYLHDTFSMDVVEMDDIIAKREGMSISDIFETHGEQYFRDLETNLLVEMQNKSNVVISCGGGTPMRENNVLEMKKNGRVVLLTAQPETVLQRVKDNHDRPLLENNKNVSFIADLMAKRSEKYEAAADIIIQTDGKNEQEICEEMIQRLRAMDESRQKTGGCSYKQPPYILQAFMKDIQYLFKLIYWNLSWGRSFCGRSKCEGRAKGFTGKTADDTCSGH